MIFTTKFELENDCALFAVEIEWSIKELSVPNIFESVYIHYCLIGRAESLYI